MITCSKELAMSARVSARTGIRGISHVALITPDMDATVRFYVGVLHLRLVHTMALDVGRHYFFETADSTRIAFFEYAHAGMVAKPAGVPTAFPMQLDHLALAVSDRNALIELRARLRAAGIEVTDVVEHGMSHSVYFSDTNGVALEATCPRASGGLNPEHWGDRSPVAAVTELRRVLDIGDSGAPACQHVSELIHGRLADVEARGSGSSLRPATTCGFWPAGRAAGSCRLPRLLLDPRAGARASTRNPRLTPPR